MAIERLTRPGSSRSRLVLNESRELRRASHVLYTKRAMRVSPAPNNLSVTRNDLTASTRPSNQNRIFLRNQEMNMKMIKTANPLLITIATALIGAAASSFAILPAAADDFDAPRVTVKYGDLDVSTPAGSSVLFRRIELAAKTVCSRFDDRDLPAIARRNACLNAAIRGAIIQVNNPTLNAVYAAKTGTPAAIRLASLSN